MISRLRQCLRAWWLGRRDCGLADVDRKGRTPAYDRGVADGRNVERASREG